MRLYFFGVRQKGDGQGHRLWNPAGSSSEAERSLPFAYRILDAGLLGVDFCPAQPEGRVRRVVIAGWTVLTFWDRSGDSRPGSNSAFVIEGDHDAATGLDLARRRFPELFARFTFPLTPEV